MANAPRRICRFRPAAWLIVVAALWLGWYNCPPRPDATWRRTIPGGMGDFVVAPDGRSVVVCSGAANQHCFTGVINHGQAELFDLPSGARVAAGGQID